MNIVSGRRALIKLVIVVVVGLGFGGLALMGERNKARASAEGPSPSHTDAPGEANCTVCHVDNKVNSGTGRVTISGIPHDYLPGQQIPITVTTAQEDAVVYGFQLTAIDTGPLLLPGSRRGQPHLHGPRYVDERRRDGGSLPDKGEPSDAEQPRARGHTWYGRDVPGLREKKAYRASKEK